MSIPVSTYEHFTLLHLLPSDVRRQSNNKFTQAHLNRVDEDTKKKLLKSDHFRKDPLGAAYMCKAVWCILPGDVIPVCINKCLIQFMKGYHNLSNGNSCRSGFSFGGSPSTATMEAIDSAYGGGIQYGSNVKNVLCMNGRVGHCSISPGETKTCRCDKLDKDETGLRVKQLNFFEDAFRAKGAIGFYHSFAGEAAGVVRNIIDKLDIDPHQKSEDTYHLQHFSSEPVLCLSSRRQLDKCTKVMKGVSERYEHCCAVHAEDSGVSRAAGATRSSTPPVPARSSSTSAPIPRVGLGAKRGSGRRRSERRPCGIASSTAGSRGRAGIRRPARTPTGRGARSRAIRRRPCGIKRGALALMTEPNLSCKIVGRVQRSKPSPRSTSPRGPSEGNIVLHRLSSTSDSKV